MKILKSYLLFVLIIFTGSCVSKSKHDKILKENIELKNKLKETQKKVDSLILDQQLMDLVRQNMKNYTKKHANKILKNYYSFYERDMIYRNVKINKINNNTFEISLEEGTKSLVKKSDSDVFWNGAVFRLTIKDESQYNMERMR